MQKTHTKLQALVAELGGQTAVARRLGVSKQAVHHWLTRGISVSGAQLMEQLGGRRISAEELLRERDLQVRETKQA